MSILPESPRRRRRLVLVAGVVAVLGGMLLYLTVTLDRRREVDELRAMSDTLATLRMAADSCRAELAREEIAFRRFAAEVDSLRSRVSAFESLDTAGVPQEDYPEYLAAFDRYNEAVPDWEARADTLRAHESACRALAERHNLLADSLRRRVERWRSEGSG